MPRLGPTGVASLVSILKNWIISLLNTKANTSHTHGKSDITDLPTIPTKVSDLTNDSGFLTAHNPVDSSLSSTSSNAVQNKVIYTALNNKADSSHTHTETASYDNDEFLIRQEDQNNMNTLLILSTSVPDEYTFDIRSATEVTHSFSKTELSTLSKLMVAAVNNLYAEYWELKDKLYKCTTAEEVEKINW